MMRSCLVEFTKRRGTPKRGVIAPNLVPTTNFKRTHLFNESGTSDALLEFGSLDVTLRKLHFPRGHLPISANARRGRLHLALSNGSQPIGLRGVMRGNVFDGQVAFNRSLVSYIANYRSRARANMPGSILIHSG